MKRTIDLVVIILLFLVLLGLLTMAAYSVGGQTLETPPSAGGQFSVHATAGQAAAGHRLNGGQFRVYSGFWTPEDLMPTAADVTVSGRVMTASGQGVRNVLLTLTDQHGLVKQARSGSFGYYSFDEVRVGEMYVLTATAKRYRFAPLAITVVDHLADVDLIGEE